MPAGMGDAVNNAREAGGPLVIEGGKRTGS